MSQHNQLGHIPKPQLETSLTQAWTMLMGRVHNQLRMVASASADQCERYRVDLVPTEAWDVKVSEVGEWPTSKLDSSGTTSESSSGARLYRFTGGMIIGRIEDERGTSKAKSWYHKGNLTWAFPPTSFSGWWICDYTCDILRTSYASQLYFVSCPHQLSGLPAGFWVLFTVSRGCFVSETLGDSGMKIGKDSCIIW